MVKLFNAFPGGKIGVNDNDIRAAGSEAFGCALNLGFIGRDDQIVTLLRRIAGKLMAESPMKRPVTTARRSMASSISLGS